MRQLQPVCSYTRTVEKQLLSFRHASLGESCHFIVQSTGLAQQCDRNRGTAAFA
jgi:hypothetical protein